MLPLTKYVCSHCSPLLILGLEAEVTSCMVILHVTLGGRFTTVEVELPYQPLAL